MSDHNNIDDVFSVPETEHFHDPFNDRSHRTVPITVQTMPITTDDPEQTIPSEQDHLNEQQDLSEQDDLTTIKDFDPYEITTHSEQPETPRQTLFPQAQDPLFAEAGSAIDDPPEKKAYFQLVQQKTTIALTGFQNPAHRTANLALLQRVNTAIQFLEELLSSGKTIAEAQQETAQLNEEILRRVHAQINNQRSRTEEKQEPFDNQQRNNQNLHPLSISLGEDLRLKLLKA